MLSLYYRDIIEPTEEQEYVVLTLCVHLVLSTKMLPDWSVRSQNYVYNVYHQQTPLVQEYHVRTTQI